MIISFQHKGVEKFYKTGSTKGVQVAHVKKLRHTLGLLDIATSTKDIALPSLNLHPLKGSLDGYWSVTVNGNWRVIFRFVGADVELVDYLDYH